MLLFPGTACVLAFAVAVALRPWRTLGPGGPPWPWLLLVRRDAVPVDRRPLERDAGGAASSGACLLLLMAGWPWQRWRCCR
ncbi:MAG: hypothetical protein U1F67_08950 [Rubrivivax sp.]